MANDSYIGRTGLKCEFTACPGENDDLWRMTTDNKTGITFQYSETLPTEYIHVVDWPPQVQILNELFACTEAWSETARAGKTMKRMVNDRIYCVIGWTEGAAGIIILNMLILFQKTIKR